MQEPKFNMSQRDEVQKFEQGRIKVLQEERLHIQKKTFTKWMNSFLQKARMEVDDLFVDLADGKKLLKLLEVISGEKLAKANNGKMRVHKIENVNKSLAFLHTKVRLESIGAEDIVDGNPRLILGLIWTIILRFQIQEIEIQLDEENESSERKSAKDALLLWAQRKTRGYNGVEIKDFSNSWRSGLGFNALIHSHRPDLFDYDNLIDNKNIDNLNHAFDVANNELGIPSLLDAEDIDTTRPDEKSIMTYVASYYHTFARMKNEEKSGRRIAKIVSQMVEADKMKVDYHHLTTDLLDWINFKIVELDNRIFPNSLEGIQTLLVAFGQYRTQEKPPKYKERSEIEALYFNINTQLKELRQPMFNPSDGKLVQDIERAWEILEKAEHKREVALRNELLRQQRLEQLNYKFCRKSILREGYLKEMIQVLSDPRYGSNLAQVEATVKKHEAISADILAREQRMHDLTQMCNELVKEKYRNSDNVQATEAEIMRQWHELMDLLEKHKMNLNRMLSVMAVLRETDTAWSTIEQLKMDLSSTDVGIHLMAVEDLLQRHALQELQVTSLGESERKLTRSGEQIATQNPKEAAIIKRKLSDLSKIYHQLINVSDERKALLEEARNFYQFLQDQEDEEAWLIEKQRICQTGITAKDLRSVLSLQQKHAVLVDEIQRRRNKFDQLEAMGNNLIVDGHSRSNEIEHHIERNKSAWKLVEQLVQERTKQLQDAAEAYQFYADANETESWFLEKTSILASKDLGNDEPSATALLKRHKDLESELNAYDGDIQSLNAQANRLVQAGISNLDLNVQSNVAENVEETQYEMRMMATEVWVDEPIEKIEYRNIVEERKVPQVRALYAFSDHDHAFTILKGEQMFLLNKSNPDWWCVRKADGTDGFAPANYVVEIEPRIMQVNVRKPETVKSVQKIKKTKMVRTKVPIKVLRPTPRLPKQKIDDNNSVPKRQNHINDTYKKLQEMAMVKRASLEDSIRLFRFYRECNDFERWIRDKEKLLSEDDPNDSVLQAKRKYEKFVTDLSGSTRRMDELQFEEKEFEKQNHLQVDQVRVRFRQIQLAWQKLNRLKALKEKSLQGASSVELYNKLCDEAKDWMLEKMLQLEGAVLGHDLKTVQALQRRHDNLERELAPVKDKVNKVTLLANDVQAQYPSERHNIAKKQADIDKLWAKVKDAAIERRARLEDAVGQQIFTNGAKNLIEWIADVKGQLNADNLVKDVQTAHGLLKDHHDLNEEIKAKNDEFEQLMYLGNKLLNTNPELYEIRGLIQRIEAEQAALGRGWNEKNHWLQQCLKLQEFNKEADNIDAVTTAHLVFLEFNNLGNSLNEVEALQKQHRAFTNTLNAQDERLTAFIKRADGLIADNHYDSKAIEERRIQVLDKRIKAKNLCQQRANALDASRSYQEFEAEVEDLKKWIEEKQRTASDESYRDLNNLERKIQKHEAFERELRANEGRLRSVSKLGSALISQGSYQHDDIAATLKDLNHFWKNLISLSLEKGKRLRQAEAQNEYNNAVDDVKVRLEEIEASLKSTNVGMDLRSCRDLLKKHEALENELNHVEDRVNDLVVKSDDMSDEDHFDSETIRNAALASQQHLKVLEKPSKARRVALENALKFYKFSFTVDSEIQWIKERMPQATSDVIVNSLHQAQNFHKKNKKVHAEIVGHKPVIDKVLVEGQYLINEKHLETANVKKLCDNLHEAWLMLEDNAAKRQEKLDLSLRAQQYFFEASEVESWLNEKDNILDGNDYGRDRDSATKLLTKHKALELELDTYYNIIMEMGHGAQVMIKSGHPDSKLIFERQSSLEHLVRSLQRKAAQRQQRLMESLFRHEYFIESDELECWITENLQYALSEDYGQDFEHLLILISKFNDLKHRIEAGVERYNHCEALTEKLLSNENAYSEEISSKQNQLEESWNNLHDQIKKRDERLNAAGEIHRFHRDVAEALQRIHAKNAALGTDLGRDLNSAIALYRKHEVFENELVVLEAQLQVLVEDASKLLKIYPTNRKKIHQQQTFVVEDWNALKERTDSRKDQLQGSVDLQKFLAQVRDLTNWATNLQFSMNAEAHARTAAQSQLLKNEHDALKGEIEAREIDFRNVAEILEAMEQTGHYAVNEAIEKYKILIQEREKLHNSWQLKKIHLDQLCDLHIFLREAKLLEDACNGQEASLGYSDFEATDVEEVANQLKKHDAFEKLVIIQDKNLESLTQSGNKLIKQNHYESGLISSKLHDIELKRNRIHTLSDCRTQFLQEALFYAEFIRDAAEVLGWITEKQKKMDIEGKINENTNLEEKIKILQKHQAFYAEVSANINRIEEVQSNGLRLIAKKHKFSSEIQKQLDEIQKVWSMFIQEVNLRNRGLKEAQDILEFTNLLEKLEAWIRDKEVMIQAGDTGKDYEHCQQLQRKLDDVDSDMRIDDSKINRLSILADKLAKQSQVVGVVERRNDFINKWRSLQGALNSYRNKLGAALEIHLFDRDVNDTMERIKEKCAAMEVDDGRNNLATTEALLRKHDALETEIKAIQTKVQEDHQMFALKLVEKYPYSANHLQEKLQYIYESMIAMNNAKENRKKELLEAHFLNKFQADVKEFDIWVNETIKRMENYDKASSMNLELHKEVGAEIKGRDEAFKELILLGKTCPLKEHPVIVDNVAKFEQLQETIEHAWENMQFELQHEHNIQDFKVQANQLNNWLSSKEAFLNNDDVGDTPRSVETLLRKHADFLTTLEKQLTRVDEFIVAADKIILARPSEEVTTKLDAIVSRKSRLLVKSTERNHILNKSKALQQFLHNINDVEIWLSQKLAVAGDQNYRDLSNLQNKIQKHATFEAQVLASDERIQNVMEEGKELIVSDHYASKEIGIRLDELESDWKRLWELANLKRNRLNEAYQALLFNRQVEEFSNWLTDVEIQINSSDTGDDLATAHNLLNKHINLENDVQQYAENADQLHEVMEQFINSEHFMANEIKDNTEIVITRYHQLKEPLQVRRDLLESANLFHKFTREIEDELQWLNEKELLCSSTDFGHNLTSVQSLYKKHQTVEAELNAHESIVNSLISRAINLATSYYSITEKANQVKEKLFNVRDLASIRKLRLHDSLEAHMFYQESAEALAWIQEKRSFLATKEVGKDKDSAQSLQRKLEGLSIEIISFQPNVIDKLKLTAEKLIDREHFDIENIVVKKVQLEEEFNELRLLVSDREVRLSEALQYFEILRECNDVQEWIRDQTTKADSEEYGDDLEHIELLIQAFDSFHTSLLSSEPRVSQCIENGNVIISGKSSYSAKVQNKLSELKNSWDDLIELANARKEALNGAKQVHLFDRTAEEIILWIQEKESYLVYGTNVQDSEAIEESVRKHQELETEMKAIKDRVDFIMQEGDRLIAEFPDTKEHIDDKKEDTLTAWEDLQLKVDRERDFLQQTEQLQFYFDEYQELLAWINEMLAKITTPDLPQEPTEAEQLINRHNDYKTEIDSHIQIFKTFFTNGNRFIEKHHPLAHGIEEKMAILQQRMELLINIWNQRKIIYDMNLDVQLFKKEAHTLESWLLLREDILRDGKLGDSIIQVENLIKKHRDFEETIKSQDEKFEALKRSTLLEESFTQQLKQEEVARKAEHERLEQEKLKKRKRQEMEKFAQLRRQESGSERDSCYAEIPENLVNIRKTNSIAQMFDRERVARRGPENVMKRAESMRVGAGPNKPVKRTPSFTTRRKGSFRSKNSDVVLPPVEAEGFLDRKQILLPGSKRASNRAWKSSYTVLCGQLVCFFKNKDDFIESKASSAPLNIHNASCSLAVDYHKRRFTFRLIIADGSEFLFSCNSEIDMNDWLNKITFRARLPPSQQLLHFDVPNRKEAISDEISSQSSRTSSPDVVLDNIAFRHDTNSNNDSFGSSSKSSRNTFESPPPPLPRTEPPVHYNNTSEKKYKPYNMNEGNANTFGDSPPRSANSANTLSPDNKMSHRIRELFGRKKRNNNNQT